MIQHRTEIFTPRYEGERFKNHRFPLEFLEDLKILQEMTVETAKYVFREKNSDRERISRNFTTGVSFELESIEEGSTIPKIVLITTMVGLFPDQTVNYFAEASSRIIQAVQAANDGGDIHHFLPDHVLSYFNRFGKKLDSEDFIEFSPRGEKKAKFTRETRKTLILASSKANEYTEDILLRGMITAMDKHKNSFEIQRMNSQKIKGTYQPENLELLQHAFIKLEEKQKVLIKATGFFSRNGKLESIKEIEEVHLLEDFDVPARLEELSQLKQGWLDGEGTPPNIRGIEWLSKTFDENFNPTMPLPATFPTPDGGIQFEWSLDDWEASLKVDLQTHLATYEELELSSDSENAERLNLDMEDDWQRLNQLLLSKPQVA